MHVCVYVEVDLNGQLHSSVCLRESSAMVPLKLICFCESYLFSLLAVLFLFLLFLIY